MNEMNPSPPTDPGPIATFERKPFSPFPIVGVGASAGGFDALTELLSYLPQPTGMAFLVVQHLDPHHESRLTDLLARRTRMAVQEAQEGMSVQPDHVYVIPPAANLGIQRGTLQVTRRGDTRPHLPVDYTFRSLAEEQQGRAIGVVLSGSGSDGALGVGEIKSVGGINFAQKEGSARHPEMPRNAVDSGCIDFILSPKEIAQRLAEIGSHPYLAAKPEGVEPERPPIDDGPHYQKVLHAVRSITGVDFTHYRDTTIRRRIMRRMALHACRSLEDYSAKLEKDRAEVEALYRDLLINVTGFFRDAETFEVLKRDVLPEIVKNKVSSTPIRIWVPGCSTGQEAYSLAMLLWEYFDDRPLRPQVQIFATDLSDPGALERARAGVYPESIEAEVSPERLRRFFRKEDHVYRVDKSIRESCIFARQNLAADPPFSHVDLISCRNVLIYMSPLLQKRVLPTFHYALNHPGYLLLGSAESVGEYTDLFDLVDRAHRIYAKRSTANRPPLHFALDENRAAQGAAGLRSLPFLKPSDFQREADRLALNRFSPPGVLVNSQFDVIQFRGRTSPYLEAPAGDPTVNVLKMAREGLLLELRNALNEAKTRNTPVFRDGVRVVAEGDSRDVAIEVLPVQPADTNEVCFLVLFHDAKAAPPRGGSGRDWPARKGRGPVPAPHGPGSEAQAENTRLRHDLAATKEYLQSLVEQQDAANEELRSANEEILSSNEELQSTNEELETAKEELQSTNEELITVNEQLQQRNIELNQTTNDLINLLASMAIPVVMVGSDLRIRRITGPARQAMNLLPTDVGRPIGDIKANVDVPDLEALVTEVVEQIQVRQREVQDRSGAWYLLRVHPYRTADNRIDGAVILLLDIDPLKRAQVELTHQADLLRRQASLIELSSDAVIVRDAQDRILLWSRGAEETYGYADAEARGQVTLDLLKAGTLIRKEELDRILDRDGRWEGELIHTRADGTRIVVHSRQVTVHEPGGSRAAVLEINRDITERKRTEESLRQTDRRKNEFLAMLSHELRNPLAPMYNALQILRLTGDEPARRGYAGDILDRQIRQLVRIVDDLLDMSRIVQGRMELRKTRVALEDVVQGAVETVRSALDAGGHELTIRLPSTPVYLDADPQRLSQALANLLHNAAKFTDPGGRILMQASLETPGGEPADDGSRDQAEERVVIRVQDSGIGIAPDLLPHVFELFTQGDRSLERTRGGLGVGLALVMNLVQMHGGAIEAKSEGIGKGSEFVLSLPVATPPRRGAMPEPPELPSEPQGGTPPRRVLVIDDNRDAAESLRMLLEVLGHTVRIAHDGETALESAAAFKPRIVLIDIGLPGMSGYELARAFRRLEGLHDMVIVALTGYGTEEDRRRSEEAGFDYHLVKPAEVEDLQKLFAEERGGAA